MKLTKLIAGLALAASAFSISSCSEDFDVAAPYKDVTLVYGFLNVDDGAQYIRIQKVFMDQNRSAYDLAKIPDSNYFRNLEVHLKALNNNSVVTDDVLPKVDMATENLPKDQGTFFQAPSYAYKATRALNAAYRYRLVVKNLETGNVDSAETSVINTNGANGAGNFYIPLFSLTNAQLAFNNVAIDNKYSLQTNVPTNAKYLEGFIRIKYASQIGSGPQTDSSFTWNFARAVYDPNLGAQSVALTVDRSEFYSVLASNIKADPGIKRYLDSADVYVWAASQEFYNYMQINAAQGGITADQIKTNYTNVMGKDVLGLFASRSMRIRYNIPFTRTTLDSIKRNDLTKNLNFIDFADH